MGHVIQLGIEAFMTIVTQTALVESKQAIWEYDPLALNSAVVGGLDVIAIIRTLAIKVLFRRIFKYHLNSNTHLLLRFRLLANANRSSTTFRCRMPKLHNPSSFRYMATHAGGVHGGCFHVHTSSVRCVLVLYY